MANTNSNAIEQLKFKLKLQLLGYASTGPAITVNQTISQIADVLTEANLPQLGNFTSMSSTRKEVFSMAKKFMEEKFQLHKINSGSQKQLENVAKNGFDDIEDFLSKIKKKTSTIKPFDLPVSFVNGHSMIGETQKSLLLFDNKEYLQKEPIVFSVISLGNNLTPLSAGSYCHEITHTQIESQKGITLEYTNKEVLPILIEKIFALEVNSEVLNKSQLARFRFTLDILNSMKQLPRKTIKPTSEDFDSAIYIPGTLQALRLFDIYKDGSDQVRNEMLLNIQKVFDGQLTVEDLLAFYNVTYENSQDSDLVKKHLR